MADAPFWLNLEAFDIPQGAVDDLRQTLTELRAMVLDLERLSARAKPALDALTKYEEDKNLPDDVSNTLCELTGVTELFDVMGCSAGTRRTLPRASSPRSGS